MKSVIDKLEEIDEILMGYEDWMHGKDGYDCTKARAVLRQVIKEIQNNSKNGILG
jgi:hypothetical protein